MSDDFFRVNLICVFLLLQFVDLGVVTSIEYNHKPVESARKGQEVCVKIEPVPGEAPKMFGRHFDEKDFIVSRVSCQNVVQTKTTETFVLIKLARVIN